MAVGGQSGEPAMLCVWRVEAGTRSGQRQVRLHAVAVDTAGRRLPSIERQVESVMRATPTRPAWSTEERLRLLAGLAEPALQRELRQRAAAGETGGYAAELIGYVEIVPNP